MQRVREQIACPDPQMCSGTPVTIGILDTGAAKHPDFKDRIVAFCDFVNGRKDCYDDSGHGTHVCGIAAGDGTLSEGKYRGIAPESLLIVGKVLNEEGDGSADHMIEGLNWMLELKEPLGLRIINISIGVGNLKDKQKKQELLAKLEEVRQSGILVICAAGNLGPAKGSISPLGVSRRVITVGCHDGNYYSDYSNRCETYSGRGPTKDAIRKPDLVAPGTEIVSCNAFFSLQRKGRHVLTMHPVNAYTAKSGTSMATPMVTGAAALLLQKNPSLNPEQIKKQLLYSATDLGEPWTKQGWGMLNIRKALEI